MQHLKGCRDPRLSISSPSNRAKHAYDALRSIAVAIQAAEKVRTSEPSSWCCRTAWPDKTVELQRANIVSLLFYESDGHMGEFPFPFAAVVESGGNVI